MFIVGWRCFGGAEVGALLVHVAFEHGNRLWRVFAYESRGELGLGGVVFGVNGGAPGGECRGEVGGIEKGNEVGDCGGWEDGVGCVER